MSGRDLETRERLLRTAARLFADRGFKRVTVRTICQAAHANVAAVNYHFGNKLGLYGEVLKTAIGTIQSTTDAAKREGEGCRADEKLRRYIQIYLRALLARPDDWIHRLMHHEISEPTPALDTLVDRGLKPRIEYLSGIVADLLACAPDDPRVIRSVISVQVQSLAYLPNAIGSRLGLKAKLSTKEIDDLARHIVAFSLAGIRAVATGRRSVTHRALRRESAPSSSP